MEIFSKETMEIVGQTLAGLGDNAQNAFIAYLSVPVLLEVVYWLGVCILVSVIFKGILKIVAHKPHITINKPVVERVADRIDAKLVRKLKLYRDDSHIVAYDGELYQSVLTSATSYIRALEALAGETQVADLRHSTFGQMPEKV